MLRFSQSAGNLESIEWRCQSLILLVSSLGRMQNKKLVETPNSGTSADIALTSVVLGDQECGELKKQPRVHVQPHWSQLRKKLRHGVEEDGVVANTAKPDCRRRVGSGKADKPDYKRQNTVLLVLMTVTTPQVETN